MTLTHLPSGLIRMAQGARVMTKRAILKGAN